MAASFSKHYLFATGSIVAAVFLIAGIVTLGAASAAQAAGDANCNGIVNSIDATILLQLDAGLITSIGCPVKADVNGDGHVNAIDATLILQFDAGLITHIGPTATRTRTRTPTLQPQETPADTPEPGTTATPTHTFVPPTDTPLPPTATPTTSGSCSVIFSSFYNEPDEFCGVVTDIQRLDSIAGSFFDPVYAPPGADFAAVLMSVTNTGSEPDDVGIFSFRLQDSNGRRFTIDFPEDLNAQFNAEDHYGRHGLYATIQPGLTDSMVFIFLVPEDATSLTAERCLINGCDSGVPPPPSPPGGCSILFPSFYTELDAFCGTAISMERTDSLPGTDFTDPSTAPAGSDFLIAFMTVKNYSYGPSDVGIFSFRMRDQMSRVFTMDFPDEFDAQWNAQQHYALGGTYQTIQPSLQYNLVFVFLVPETATTLSPERCPASGGC